MKIMDISLRDGQQSLWGTRLQTKDIAPIASTYNDVGFEIVDVNGGAVIDTAVLHQQEPPFARIRLLRDRLPNSKLNFWSRGQSLFRWKQYPDDVAEFCIKVLAKNGISAVHVIDGLNDMRNVRGTVQAAKAVGLWVAGAVCYTVSPVHTDEHFVEKARDLADLGVDAVTLKDPSGILEPMRAVKLIKAFRAAVPKGVEIHLHTHCTGNHAYETHREVLALGDDGVDMIHGAIRPLSGGGSHPSHEYITELLDEFGVSHEIDGDKLREVSSYFDMVAERRGFPTGDSSEPHPGLMAHQMPGGMWSNLVRQLGELGQEDKLAAVMEEVPRVRAELGYALMVSPLSQYIATQAMMNVLGDERYSVVPEEIRQLALGYYGELPGPIDQDVLDRIAPEEEILKRPVSEVLEPMMSRHVNEYGPFDDDEDLFVSLFYSERERDVVRRAPEASWATTPLAYLIQEIANNEEITSFSLSDADLAVRIDR